MPDREKVIKALEICIWNGPCSRCGYHLADYYVTASDCRDQLMSDVLTMLKEQEPREITKDEWELWKKDKHRDPLCMYWRGDVTPFWILRPEEVHEPAYLIGDIKIFKGKPDKEKMHRMWLKQEE